GVPPPSPASCSGSAAVLRAARTRVRRCLVSLCADNHHRRDAERPWVSFSYRPRGFWRAGLLDAITGISAPAARCHGASLYPAAPAIVALALLVFQCAWAELGDDVIESCRTEPPR